MDEQRLREAADKMEAAVRRIVREELDAMTSDASLQKENGIDAEDIDPLGSFRAPNDWTASTLRIIVRDAVRIRHAFIRLFILNGAAIAIGIVLLLLKAVR